MQNLQLELTSLLKKDERFVAEGKLLKNPIIEAALQLNPVLLKLLLSSKTMKKHFFRQVELSPLSKGGDTEGVLVFDKIEFQKFVSNKSFLKDSYTAFSNKIGLTSDDEFISESKDVVLSWPHKDCVLEGGQTKEDEKRDEIFWNETLAPDEIDRLLSPKVFTNFKKYDSKGEHNASVILSESKNIDDYFLNQNLIIKGNNLLALHSLLPVYRGRIKLIYIDPPFNTNSAANTFAYNNSFNHSSWLTFMKNRLEVAKALLSEDGILVVAIDHYELFYLGVLADEIFTRDNRMGVIAVVHNPGGRQDDYFFPTAHENMLFYAKNISQVKLNTLGVSQEKLSEYKFIDKFGKYKLRGLRRSGNNSLRTDRPGLYYSIYYNPKENIFSLKKESKDYIELLPIDEKGVERCWRWGPQRFINNIEKYIEAKKNKNGFDIYIKERESDYEGEKAKTIWDKPYYSGQSGTTELKNIFGEKVFSYPKSPHLLMDVVQITTSKNDIVLDFFGGSGTTAAAVLGLNQKDGGNRKFIICEQMDYVDNVTKERLKLTLDQQKSNSFIYSRLNELNKIFVNQIKSAKATNELKNIWATIKKDGFISYKVNPKEIDKNISEFEELSISDQKKFLTEVLDKNHLYVNYSEIDDKDYNITEDDKKLNKKFYSLK